VGPLALASSTHSETPRAHRLSEKARARIARAQRKRWRLAKQKSRAGSGITNYWARMSKQERGAEMQRRRNVTAQKRAAKKREERKQNAAA